MRSIATKYNIVSMGLLMGISCLLSSFTLDDTREKLALLNGIYGRYTAKSASYTLVTKKTVNNQPESPITAQIVQVGEQAMFKTDFITVYADDKDQVMIVESDNTIIIQSQEGEDEVNQDFNLDTLKKYTTSIDFTGSGSKCKLRLIYNNSYTAQTGIGAMVIQYDETSRLLTKTETIYSTRAGITSETATYSNLRENIKTPLFYGGVDNTVLYNGRLKSKYAGFFLRDLRKK